MSGESRIGFKTGNGKTAIAHLFREETNPRAKIEDIFFPRKLFAMVFTRNAL
jgi:hypothetical protein